MASNPSSALPPGLVDELLAAREQQCCFPPGLRSQVERFAQRVLGVLFPHFADEVTTTRAALERDLRRVELALEEILESLATQYPDVHPAVAREFVHRIPETYHLLRVDAEAIEQGDPAARSVDEVILTYPGFFAIAIYRIANVLHRLGTPIVPRLLTEYAHQKTGVDIHPGATIGRRFTIDHGTGVVIGETTVIGEGVKLYQGVTLGALTVEKLLADRKRHPTLGDRVVVYSNATILGGETVIGDDSVIGGNAWLTQSVPPGSIVTHKAEVRQRKRGEPADFSDLEFVI